MPAKATHAGHCQVCGARQMLPGGTLAKHGYTTRWGFFSGVCSGSGHLPFEQDTSLIEQAVARALAQAESLRQEAARIEAISDPNDVYDDVYHSGELGRFMVGYHEHHGRLETRGIQAHFIYKYGDKEMVYNTTQVATTPERLAQVAKVCNGHAANRRLAAAKQADEYVAWQRSRIKDWQPKPLIARD